MQIKIQKKILFNLLTLINIFSFLTPKTLFFGSYIKKNSKTKILKNYLSLTRNQNQPKVCNSSWAFAVTSSLGIYFNLINVNIKKSQYVFSPQMLMDCVEFNFSCDYNKNFEEIEKVFEHLKSFGVSDEGCNNYTSNDEGFCKKINKCSDCKFGIFLDKRDCFSKDYHNYKIKDFKKIISEKNDLKKKQEELSSLIFKALENKGPLVCLMNHSEKIFESRTNNFDFLYEENEAKDREYSTWVVLVGFENEGEKDKYIVQTSFGENIGYYGFLKVEAGVDNKFNLNDNCYYMEPDSNIELIINSNSKKKDFSSQFLKKVKHTKKEIFYNKELNKKKNDFSYIFNNFFLKNKNHSPIDWRDFNDQNYLTYIKNQHIPVYCGSCWAQAATSVLADRLNIQNINQKITFPKLTFSVQSLINCKSGGSCFGGDEAFLFSLLEKKNSFFNKNNFKIPIETCKIYKSRNPDNFFCNSTKICSLESKNKFYNIKNFSGIQIKKWGRVRGVEYIKEILIDGPITCNLFITPQFKDYKKNKFTDKIKIFDIEEDFFSMNHVVSIVGWNKDEIGEYWIVRNSWGREWGDDGFIFMRSGKNLLGIESNCAWAIPEFVEFD